MAAKKKAKPKAPQPAHAELGASSASRWMACPGSIRMCRDLPDRRSVWAAEGTAAHAVGEKCLTGNRTPDSCKGDSITVDGDTFTVDDDMIAAVQVYVDHIQDVGYNRGTKKDPVHIEKKVSLSAYADNPDDILHQMFGTADYIRYLWPEKTLLVADYKHGAGVKVEAEGNAQSRYYALGALAEFRGFEIQNIETHIIQPRCDPDNPISIERIDIVDLLDWSTDLFDAARDTQDPNAPLIAGKHCRFCPAQGVCPQVREQRMQAAQLVFHNGKDGQIVPAMPPERLKLDQLRAVLDSADDITAWVNACQKLAHDMLDTGMTDEDRRTLGYKLVAKRAMRKWRDEQGAADWLCEQFGLGDEDIYGEPKIKSPAQIEKQLDKHGKKLLKDADLIVAESSGNTLAPESDKRPAVEGRAGPESMFEPVVYY